MKSPEPEISENELSKQVPPLSLGQTWYQPNPLGSLRIISIVLTVLATVNLLVLLTVLYEEHMGALLRLINPRWCAVAGRYIVG